MREESLLPSDTLAGISGETAPFSATPSGIGRSWQTQDEAQYCKAWQLLPALVTHSGDGLLPT